MRIKASIEIEIPEGFQPVRFGFPEPGEMFIRACGLIGQVGVDEPVFGAPRLIVRRVKQYRDPVLPADYGKKAMVSNDGKEWLEAKLVGWRKVCDSDHWVWYCEVGYFRFCQVEAEPEPLTMSGCFQPVDHGPDNFASCD